MYERYCKLRDLKGLNDAQVSEYCDFPKSTFSDWKKGKSTPKTDKIVKIAECLECSIDYLVTGKESIDSTFTEESAKLVAKIRNDKALSEALEKYFTLSEAKQKHVLELINLLSEEWLYMIQNENDLLGLFIENMDDNNRISLVKMIELSELDHSSFIALNKKLEQKKYIDMPDLESAYVTSLGKANYIPKENKIKKTLYNSSKFTLERIIDIIVGVAIGIITATIIYHFGI